MATGTKKPIDLAERVASLRGRRSTTAGVRSRRCSHDARTLVTEETISVEVSYVKSVVAQRCPRSRAWWSTAVLVGVADHPVA
jgi:hypothetical protein